MQRSAVISALPQYKGEEKTLVSRQSFGDIQAGILNEHRLSGLDYDKISEGYWKGSPHATCMYIFDFCKKNMRYVEESGEDQTVRTPAAIMAEGKTVGVDCKHYSLFICGILDSLARKGYPIQTLYRFVAYPTDTNPNNQLPGHVFAVAVLGNKLLFVDPVLTYLDQRTPAYNRHIDKIPSDMALKRVSGIPQGSHFHHGHQHKPHWLDRPRVNGLIGENGQPFVAPPPYMINGPQSMLTGENGVPYMASVGKKKHHGLHIKAPHIKLHAPHIKLPHIKVPKINLKTGLLAHISPLLIAGRNAFLLLLKKNVFGLAADLHNKAYNMGKGGTVDKFWKHIGGNTNKLHTAINQGVSNYNRHHSNRKIGFIGYDSGYDSGHYSGYTVGALPAIAAAIVAATPIIVKMADILKAFGIDPNKLKATAKQQDAVVQHHNGGGHKANKDGSVDVDDPDADPDDPKFTTKVVDGPNGKQVQIGVKPGSDGGDAADGGTMADGDGGDGGGDAGDAGSGGHWSDKPAAASSADGAADADDPGKGKGNITKSLDGAFDKVESFLGANSGKMVAGAGLLIGGGLVLKGLNGPKKSKTTNMILGGLIGAAGVGYYSYTKKQAE